MLLKLMLFFAVGTDDTALVAVDGEDADGAARAADEADSSHCSR